MGRKAKMRQDRRAVSELDRLVQEGIESGKIEELANGELRFLEEKIARQVFNLLNHNEMLMFFFVENHFESFMDLIQKIKTFEEEESTLL